MGLGLFEESMVKDIILMLKVITEFLPTEIIVHCRIIYGGMQTLTLTGNYPMMFVTLE